MVDKHKKHVDVIGKILESIEEDAYRQGVENGEYYTFIDLLVYDVYDLHDYDEDVEPTNSQLKSVYRAVRTLEKRGLLHSKKEKALEQFKIRNGKRYEKVIYAYLKNGKIVKQC